MVDAPPRLPRVGASPELVARAAKPALPEIVRLPTTTPPPPGLVAPTRHAHGVVDGVATQVVSRSYTDRILVLVSQKRGRIGCLIQASSPGPTLAASAAAHAALHDLPPPAAGPQGDDDDEELGKGGRETYRRQGALPISAATDLRPLFGAPPPGQDALYSLYASSIASLVYSPHANGGGGGGDGYEARPVVVGLALHHGAPPRRELSSATTTTTTTTTTTKTTPATALTDGRRDEERARRDGQADGVAEERQPEEQEGLDWDATQDDEARRFRAVLDLVARAKVW